MWEKCNRQGVWLSQVMIPGLLWPFANDERFSLGPEFRRKGYYHQLDSNQVYVGTTQTNVYVIREQFLLSNLSSGEYFTLHHTFPQTP